MKKNRHGAKYKESVGGYYRLFHDVPGTRYSTQSLVELGQSLREQSVGFGLDINSEIPAGYTYLGQFIDHDITRMRRSSEIPKDGPVNVNKLVQERTPTLDLDSLYGGGLGSKSVPYTEEGKFYSESRFADGTLYDVPRSRDKGRRGVLIGDSRNDENLLICQLHVVFMNLHNKLIDTHYACQSNEFPKLSRSDHSSARGQSVIRAMTNRISDFESRRQQVFNSVREEVTFIYQSIVVNDFLKTLLDEKVYNYLFSSAKPQLRLQSGEPYEEVQIPIEFSGAAFRFGHSLVRNFYFVNEIQNKLSLAKLFRLTGRGNLDGNNNLLQFLVDWNLFFYDERNVPNNPRQNKTSIFRPLVVSKLNSLFNEVVGNEDLLVRNLLRGNELGLPNAQDIIESILTKHKCYARQVGLTGSLTEGQIAEFPQLHPSHAGKIGRQFKKLGFHKKTPLWAYVLLEPRIAGTGKSRLGKLGSIIVGETFRSLLEVSPISIFDSKIKWDELKILQLKAPISGDNSVWSMQDVVNL